MLEPLGVVIGIIAIYYSYSNFSQFGGRIGRGFRYLLVSLVFLVLALLLRTLTQNKILPDDTSTGALSELLLYAGIIFIALTSRVSKSGIDVARPKARKK